MSAGKALTNKELAELARMMGEFQDVMVEANAAAVKLLKGPINADLTTPEGKSAWFSLVVGVGNLSEDDVLGVALGSLLALVRLHHQPKLKVIDIFPGVVEGAPS
jgi:hypothetical protein